MKKGTKHLSIALFVTIYGFALCAFIFIPVHTSASEWGAWSGWSTTVIEGTDNLQVETKKQYRYANQHITYSSWGPWSVSGSGGRPTPPYRRAGFRFCLC